jgi:hypothetical protein
VTSANPGRGHFILNRLRFDRAQVASPRDFAQRFSKSVSGYKKSHPVFAPVRGYRKSRTDCGGAGHVKSDSKILDPRR